MGILYDWYITKGAAGRLCVLPDAMMDGRVKIQHIRCTGIIDAVAQLEAYEEREIQMSPKVGNH